MKACIKCGSTTNEFQKRYEKGRITYRGICKKCYALYMKPRMADRQYRDRYNKRVTERRLEKSKFLFDYLSNSKCSNCGVDDPFVLQFHHIKEKSFTISAEIRDKSFEDIKNEVAKCIVICGNCHMKITRSNGNIWINPYVTKPSIAIIRKYILDYLISHPCVDCGERDPAVLEFDHVRDKKLFTISLKCNNYSLDKIKDEIEKCEIRCTNCHLKRTILTSNNEGWYKVIMMKKKLNIC